MSTEITLVDESKYALEAGNAIVQNQREELGEDFRPRFNRIKVPGAGSTTWEDADGNAFKELRGVLVALRKTTRLYLQREESDDNPVPDAWSTDGKTQVVPQATIDRCTTEGLPIPLTNLSKCPYYQWESSYLVGREGKGKATREYRELYIVLPGTMFPTQVQVPTTSMREIDDLVNSLAQKAPYSISGFETVLTLKKNEANGGKIKWSTVETKIGDKLPDNVYLAAKELGSQVRTLLAANDRVEDVEAVQVAATPAATFGSVPAAASAAEAKQDAEPVAVLVGTSTADEDIPF